MKQRRCEKSDAENMFKGNEVTKPSVGNYLCYMSCYVLSNVFILIGLVVT